MQQLLLQNFWHQVMLWSAKKIRYQSAYSLVASLLKSSSFLWPWCYFSLWYINFTGTVFHSTLFWRADSLEFLQTLSFHTSRALGTFAWWTASLTHWMDYKTDGSKSCSRSPIYMRLLWGFTASLLTNPIGFTLKWLAFWCWQDWFGRVWRSSRGAAPLMVSDWQFYHAGGHFCCGKQD